MFRPVEAIIRSLSFGTLKSTLYSCVLACLMRRSQHQGLFEFDIYIYIYIQTGVYLVRNSKYILNNKCRR